MRTDIFDRREDILNWIEENQSKEYIARQLKCRSDTLEKYLKKMNIDYKGNQGGKNIKSDPKYIPAKEYALRKHVNCSILRMKLIRDGIKEEKCEICGISTWQGVPIKLELHHKNRDHFDNNIDNLQILCPNCHSIQPGNSGENSNFYNKTK